MNLTHCYCIVLIKKIPENSIKNSKSWFAIVPAWTERFFGMEYIKVTEELRQKCFLSLTIVKSSLNTRSRAWLHHVCRLLKQGILTCSVLHNRESRTKNNSISPYQGTFIKLFYDLLSGQTLMEPTYFEWIFEGERFRETVFGVWCNNYNVMLKYAHFLTKPTTVHSLPAIFSDIFSQYLMNIDQILYPILCII